MSIFGYIRVSTKEQNEDRQLIALKEYNIPPRNLYIEKQSGKDFTPAYKRMLRRLSSGDLLIIKSIDRLGRNYEDIIDQWRIITKDHKADIKYLICHCWTPPMERTYWAPLSRIWCFKSCLIPLKLSGKISVSGRPRVSPPLRQKGCDSGDGPMSFLRKFWDLAEQWAQGKISVTEITKQTQFGPQHRITAK